MMRSDAELAAQIEPFDSFWEAPDDVESGYSSWARFYRANYLDRLPSDRDAEIFVVSCGPGYLVQLLADEGYRRVEGIDSFPEKIAFAERRGLPCRVGRAFAFLGSEERSFDAIFCEQELNHLTKEEMRDFLELCRKRLKIGGRLIVHGLNGANPITGAEALAQNYDHYNSFTAYSLEQILEHCGFRDIEVFPLHLYVFYGNPANYVAWGAAAALNLMFRACFLLYGKKNKLWSKKIGATAVNRGERAPRRS